LFAHGTSPNSLPSAKTFCCGLWELLAKQGRGFAFPSHTVYFGKDAGLDREMTEAATQKTRQWRDEERLPFLDFPPEEIAEMRDSVPYPQYGSAFKGSTIVKK